ncbi:MAG TPA: FkbM family methyltransferase, partial [Brevibacterium sp.]|nr:FkbM family methyltransferase [Brevibacterium sp.]
RPDRCEIAKELYWGGGSRPEAEDAYAIDLVVRLAGDARTFFDVGAYTGIFSLATLAAHPHLRAHAFDMVPPVVRMLRANLARNGFVGRAVVHQAGVGDPALTARMPSVDRGSALPSFLSSDMAFDGGQDVGFLSLDSLTDEVEGPIVMKVDVEGGEPEVFAHGGRFLAAHRPDILCEVLADADGPRLEELLRTHGYRFFHVGADSIRERPGIVPDESVRDWLFTVKSPAQLRRLGVTVRD